MTMRWRGQVALYNSACIIYRGSAGEEKGERETE
jgi:hypothetical protein